MRSSAPIGRQAMAFVLAGGRGSRLLELTDRRAKPAVYFGGKSRIIDFALSNALNSGIRRVGVATQYKAHSLIGHLTRGWNFFRTGSNESFDIMPASQRVSENQWYAGTADAVYQNIDIIRDRDPKYMVVLAGDHIYKMDYELMLQQHVDSGADVTVGCLEVPRKKSSSFGVMHASPSNHITAFVEKPTDPPGMPDEPDSCLASMGIYVFETKFLFDQLARDAASSSSSRDFGKDIIPYLVTWKSGRAPVFDSCVRRQRDEPIGATWARSMPIGRQYRLDGCRADLDSSTGLADLDGWRGDPPAKFVMTKMAAGVRSSLFRRLHVSGAIGARFCLPACGNSYCTIEKRIAYVDAARSSRRDAVCRGIRACDTSKIDAGRDRC